MCHATSRGGESMAFKQVRNRPSLFRPWAFGDSHSLRPQEDPACATSNLTNISAIPTSEQSHEPGKMTIKHHDDISPVKQSSSGTHPFSLASNCYAIPSAFRSTGVVSRTVAPMTEHLTPVPPAFIGAPEMLNMMPDKQHLPSLSSSEGILMPAMFETKSTSRLLGDLCVPEISFPVSQLLEQPHISKLRANKKRPKKFQCSFCAVSFSNNGQLKGHIRIHTGERPFSCDHTGCGKTFTRNEELTRHKRIHTGCRPHHCVLCGKRFGRKDHLKKHVKTHQRTNVVRMPIGAFQGLSYFVSDCIPWF